MRLTESSALQRPHKQNLQRVFSPALVAQKCFHSHSLLQGTTSKTFFGQPGKPARGSALFHTGHLRSSSQKRRYWRFGTQISAEGMLSLRCVWHMICTTSMRYSPIETEKKRNFQTFPLTRSCAILFFCSLLTNACEGPAFLPSEHRFSFSTKLMVKQTNFTTNSPASSHLTGASFHSAA